MYSNKFLIVIIAKIMTDAKAISKLPSHLKQVTTKPTSVKKSYLAN